MENLEKAGRQRDPDCRRPPHLIKTDRPDDSSHGQGQQDPEEKHTNHYDRNAVKVLVLSHPSILFRNFHEVRPCPDRVADDTYL